jgi:hypothetical protein
MEYLKKVVTFLVSKETKFYNTFQKQFMNTQIKISRNGIPTMYLLLKGPN